MWENIATDNALSHRGFGHEDLQRRLLVVFGNLFDASREAVDLLVELGVDGQHQRLPNQRSEVNVVGTRGVVGANDSVVEFGEPYLPRSGHAFDVPHGVVVHDDVAGRESDRFALAVGSGLARVGQSELDVGDALFGVLAGRFDFHATEGGDVSAGGGDSAGGVDFTEVNHEATEGVLCVGHIDM